MNNQEERKMRKGSWVAVIVCVILFFALITVSCSKYSKFPNEKICYENKSGEVVVMDQTIRGAVKKIAKKDKRSDAVWYADTMVLFIGSFPEFESRYQKGQIYMMKFEPSDDGMLLSEAGMINNRGKKFWQQIRQGNAPTAEWVVTDPSTLALYYLK